MSTLSIQASTPTAQWNKTFALPIGVGILAALAMLALYLGILSVFQSFSHALEQAAQDGLWVGLVATGFGTQLGLYTYLRANIHAAKATGATATLAPAVNASAGVTGAGTGTSTLGMVACCAHHLTDLAPLVALTGASGLSGAISFLNEWKYAFIALGLVVNAVGIVITVQTIRKSRAHLNAMMTSSAVEPAPACH